MLIQKDVKLALKNKKQQKGLRALLIQKDVKLQCLYELYLTGLRALLIQKDALVVKLVYCPVCLRIRIIEERG